MRITKDSYFKYKVKLFNDILWFIDIEIIKINNKIQNLTMLNNFSFFSQTKEILMQGNKEEDLFILNKRKEILQKNKEILNQKINLWIEDITGESVESLTGKEKEVETAKTEKIKKEDKFESIGWDLKTEEETEKEKSSQKEDFDDIDFTDEDEEIFEKLHEGLPDELKQKKREKLEHLAEIEDIKMTSKENLDEEKEEVEEKDLKIKEEIDKNIKEIFDNSDIEEEFLKPNNNIEPKDEDFEKINKEKVKEKITKAVNFDDYNLDEDMSNINDSLIEEEENFDKEFHPEPFLNEDNEISIKTEKDIEKKDNEEDKEKYKTKRKEKVKLTSIGIDFYKNFIVKNSLNQLFDEKYTPLCIFNGKPNFNSPIGFLFFKKINFLLNNHPDYTSIFFKCIVLERIQDEIFNENDVSLFKIQIKDTKLIEIFHTDIFYFLFKINIYLDKKELLLGTRLIKEEINIETLDEKEKKIIENKFLTLFKNILNNSSQKMLEDLFEVDLNLNIDLKYYKKYPYLILF